MAAKENIQRPRGTEDLFGESLEALEALESLASGTARNWGYSPIRTPIFEHTGLFVRSIGEVTDIVEKEMFTIPRQTEKAGADSFTLRPENTAGVVRAYLEHNLHKTQGLSKLCYHGPQFRRERPQKGRLRQFHQMGAEILGINRQDKGSQDGFLPYVEVMLLVAEILVGTGLQDLKLRYNSVGCKTPGCRDAYRQGLKEQLSAQAEKLCADCLKRIDRNVFRVLDCKKPNCRAISSATLAEVPQQFCDLCRDQLTFISAALETLGTPGIKLELDPFLVRGLDYYTGTVFECVSGGLGSQDAVGGGGSYDGLIAQLGGPALGASGFALGLERILIAQQAAGVGCKTLPQTHEQVALLPAHSKDPKNQMTSYAQALELRRAGIRTSYDLSSGSRKLAKMLGKAEKAGARLAVIIGDQEIAAGQVNLKDMASKEQTCLSSDLLLTEVKKLLA
jgi:histidyl-tRNA synthetase